MFWKLFFRWLGLYRIRNAVKDQGTYMLEELNGLRLAGIFARDRLKKFYPRQELCLNQILNLTHEVVTTIKNFLLDDGDKLFNVPDDFYNV